MLFHFILEKRLFQTIFFQFKNELFQVAKNEFGIIFLFIVHTFHTYIIFFILYLDNVLIK